MCHPHATSRSALAGIFVTDFDGTMTARDFYRVAAERLLPPDGPDRWEAYLAGRMTHVEALAAIFADIRADESAVVAAARAMGLDPGAGAAIAQLHAAGWQVVVASAGCRWYIDRLLADQEIDVPVHAIPGSYHPSHGLRLEPTTDSPFHAASTGIDKAAVVRWAQAHDVPVAFAGDGRPDREAALLTPPARRFARGWLARRLTDDGVPFRPFAHWSDIAPCLLAETCENLAGGVGVQPR